METAEMCRGCRALVCAFSSTLQTAVLSSCSPKLGMPFPAGSLRSCWPCLSLSSHRKVSLRTTSQAISLAWVQPRMLLLQRGRNRAVSLSWFEIQVSAKEGGKHPWKGQYKLLPSKLL